MNRVGTTIAVTFALILGTALPAAAANHIGTRYTYGPGMVLIRECLIDYNWIEEVFQGKRDGWYYCGTIR